MPDRHLDARSDARWLALYVAARDLFDAIRRAAGGDRVLPPISMNALREAHAQLDPDERALVGMLLDGSTEVEIARTLSREPRDVRHAVERILSGLRIDVPASQAM